MCFTVLEWRTRRRGTAPKNEAQKLSDNKLGNLHPGVFRVSRWLSITGGSLIVLNGFFFANFGFLLLSSRLSSDSYTAQIILIGLANLVMGLSVVLCGAEMDGTPHRRTLFGALILTMSLFSSFGYFYFYNRFGLYSLYPSGLLIGNMIAFAGGALALSLSSKS